MFGSVSGKSDAGFAGGSWNCWKPLYSVDGEVVYGAPAKKPIYGIHDFSPACHHTEEFSARHSMGGDQKLSSRGRGKHVECKL